MTIDPKSDCRRPEPKPSILSIEPYKPGRAHAIGKDPQSDRVFKLSSNENPFGPSPIVVEALKNLSHLEDYPDGRANALRHALADKYGIDPQCIIFGVGSGEILSMLAMAYLEPGDEAIYSEHGFLLYKIAILTAGATPISVLEQNFKVDVDAILQAVRPKTKLVFLANPNNPTGTYLSFNEVKRLQSRLPSHVLLVLDAAYAEYVHRNDYESGLKLVSASENVVMTRTFSKIYGLANLRLGWAFGPPDVIDILDRIRGPFNISGIAQKAGLAALEDTQYIEKCALHNDIWLSKLTQKICNLGLGVTPSVGNFILIHFPDEHRHNAENADECLLQRGCVLRRVSAYGFPNALRMTIGCADANDAVLSALEIFMKS